jgi:hypothetical protein
MNAQKMGIPANNDTFVFIVGSPRSGTTILGEILDKHPQVSQWYEPYFVWDHFFRLAADDERTAADATAKVREQIIRDFSRYRKKKGTAVLVDKSPRNSLKIPFILTIFPDARFIHLLRDGRDVTLSIHKEWLRRRSITQNPDNQGRFNYAAAAKILRNFLVRQPFLQDKIRALWFETHGHIFNKAKHLNRLRWKGDIGWGPRFKSWADVYTRTSLLQFNAYQWRNCLKSIQCSWKLISVDHRLTIRYEDLIINPESKIGEIINFMGLTASTDFLSSLPRLEADNYNKWKTEFTKNQLKEIHSILTPELIDQSYAGSEAWLNGN